MQVSVIIINYNVKYYLEQCLHSVIKACANIETEIIVVDNASADNSFEYLQPKFASVTFIQQTRNTGFAKANNDALKIAKGKYILYLNPDTIVAENAIEICIAVFEEHKNTGAVGIKMIDGNGNFLPESKRSFPSVNASFWKLSGMASLFPQSPVFNQYAMGYLDEDKIHEVDVLSGAFFLSTQKILLALKGFDEAFFMYGEDIDLSYRIQRAGCKNFYAGINCIVHFKGESTQKNKPGYIKNFYGAMKIFVARHHKKNSVYFLNAAINLAAIVATISKKIKSSLPSAKKTNSKIFFLYGDEKAAASAAKILSANTCKCIILSFEKDISLILKPINSEIKKPNLVFCIDELKAAGCIQFMQQNKNSFVYCWHYKDSLSIVCGSDASATPQIYLP